MILRGRPQPGRIQRGTCIEAAHALKTHTDTFSLHLMCYLVYVVKYIYLFKY